MQGANPSSANDLLRAFWKKYFGGQDVVTWSIFESTLYHHLSTATEEESDENLLPEIELAMLFALPDADRTSPNIIRRFKQTIDIEQTDLVSIHQLMVAVNHVNLSQLLSIPHLLFYLANQEARVVLPPFTYQLTRLSQHIKLRESYAQTLSSFTGAIDTAGANTSTRSTSKILPPFSPFEFSPSDELIREEDGMDGVQERLLASLRSRAPPSSTSTTTTSTTTTTTVPSLPPPPPQPSPVPPHLPPPGSTLDRRRCGADVGKDGLFINSGASCCFGCDHRCCCYYCF